MLGSKFDFNSLFTLEMANNHQGSLEHGKRIVREAAAVVRQHGVRAAIKLQFRDLDTFIHPAYRDDKTNKHIARFLSTQLSKQEFTELLDEIRKEGMITMVTPFDEVSADLAVELDVEVIKVASCSAKDWPLLEKIASLGKPVIVSTGGMDMKEIDRLVSFLEHRYVHFALMHCVSIYPTPEDKLQLGTIAEMRERYPDLTIGFSTHEEPENMDAVKVAYALGARIFERHIGVPTDAIKLNAYSSTPDQLSRWIDAAKRAAIMEGAGEHPIDAKEQEDLHSLMRGVFAKHDIGGGEVITRDDVFFAMPLQDGQLTSGQFRIGLVADKTYKALEPVSASIHKIQLDNKTIVYDAIREVKAMLNKAHIPLNTEFDLEFSHHYGLENFREVGAVIIDCINREYCKKLIIQLPGQRHPYHHHSQKEEAFQVLYGVMEAEFDGKRRTLHPGDIAVVQRGVKHMFWTDTGTIFEEISTTHINNDSFYDDPAIARLPREARKTKLSNWGRHQL